MRLLIVEDESIIARDLATTVESFGHAVVGVVGSGEAALALAAMHRPDLVLMDIRLSGPLDGIATAQRLQSPTHIPVVYLTAHADTETMRRAAATDPAGYLLKPFDERALWGILEIAAHQQRQDLALQTSEARFAATLHSIGDAVLVTDMDGQMTFANDVALRLLGLRLDQVVGRPLDATLVLVDATTRQPIPSLVAQVLTVGEPLHLTFPVLLLAHDGQVWPIEGDAAPIRADGDRLIGMVSVVREISARQKAEVAQREAEAALRTSNAQLATALRAQERRIADLIILGDLGKALTGCTSVEEGYAVIARAAHQLFPDVAGGLYMARRTPTVLDAVITWGSSLHPHPPLRAASCRVLCEEQIFLGMETCGGCSCDALPPDLSPYALCVPLSIKGEPLGVIHTHLAAAAQTGDPSGALQRQLALAFGEQVAIGLANVRLRATLREQAIHDPLTGLVNRRYLEESMERELHRAMRDHYPVGVIMLDVDHFKLINDTYGHDAGDAVLRALGGLLRGMVRAGDVVCRYGGEEFVFILPAAPPPVVAGRAEAIRAAVSTLVIAHNDLVLPPITVSLGTSVVATSQASVAAALAEADAALYMAKRAGRNRVVAHESDRSLAR